MELNKSTPKPKPHFWKEKGRFCCTHFVLGVGWFLATGETPEDAWDKVVLSRWTHYIATGE